MNLKMFRLIVSIEDVPFTNHNTQTWDTKEKSSTGLVELGGNKSKEPVER